MRAKTDNSNYVRDLSSGALILVNKKKIQDDLEKRQQKKDIHKLRQDVEDLKAIIRDLIKEEN